MATRKDFAEEMGESYSNPEKMIEGVRKAGKKAFGTEEPSYEEEFDTAVDRSSLEAKLEELKQSYKKLKREQEKMDNLREQTRVRAKLTELADADK